MEKHKEEIKQIVVDVVNKLLEELPETERKTFLSSSNLAQAPLPFDSLNLVSLIFDLEDQIEKRFGVTLSLSDERAINQDISPFSSIQTLADYVDQLLSDQLSLSRQQK